MQRLRSSVAGKLTIWFLLLSMLPIGVMAVFVRRTVKDIFVELVADGTRSRTRMLAAKVSLLDLDHKNTVQALVAASSDQNYVASIIDEDGVYLAHSDAARVSGSISDDFSTEIVEQLLSGGEGVVVEAETDRLIGYSTVPAEEIIAVIAVDGSEVAAPIAEIEGSSFIQLAVSLAIVSIAGGVAIWIVIGPIQQLTRAAGEVGAGNLDVEIDSSEMEGELEILAITFNQMAKQLRELVGGLEQHVADRTKELATLNAIAQTVSWSLELEALLTAALDKVLEVLEFESGGVYLKDLKTGELQMACHRGLSGAFRCVVAKGIISARTSESGNPIIVDDLSKEPDAPTEVVEEGYRSVASIPLLFKGQAQGVLTVASRQLRRFRQQDVDLLLSIGRQIGVAIENARYFEAEQRRAEQFRVIGEVGHHITSILDVDELLREIVRLLKETFGYYLITVGLIEGDEIVFKAGAKTHWHEAQFRPPSLKVGGGITGWVAATGEPLLAPDVSQEPQYLSWPDAAETRSELAVPLKTKTGVIGVLNVESDQLNGFDESDLTVLQSLANQAAVAIENARLFRDTARQVRELRTLADASRIISSVLDQDELLQAVYEQITRIAPADFYSIALYDEAANVVSIEISVDEGVHYAKDRYVLDKGLLKLIIHNRQPLRFYSLTEERGRLDVEIVPSGSSKASHGWLGVPMLYGDKVVGAIIVGSYQRGTFDEGHQQILTSIANQAAVALENARLYEHSQELAVVKERQRLARDLHDAVSQTLFSAGLIAEVLPRLWERNPDEGRRRLEEIRQLTQGALAEMRMLLLELRPTALVEADVGDLLRQLTEAITGRARVPITLEVEGERECDLPPDVKVALYRIAQESLNNVAKHAEASRATVSLRCEPDVVKLQVSDDGRGFDVNNIPPDHFGVRIMRERAEATGIRLTIESEIGRGTEVAAVWSKE